MVLRPAGAGIAEPVHANLVDQGLATAVQVKLVDAMDVAVSGATLKVTPSAGASASISMTNAMGIATIKVDTPAQALAEPETVLGFPLAA